MNGKKILIGITGSIAAYKIPLLVRLLIKSGAEVKVMMTANAAQFVSPLVLSTLSKHEVTIEMSDQNTWANHVMLGRWADVMLIAPASCNTIAKMANGICDNLLLAVYLSATCPVMIAPAMDEDMWHHASLKRNLNTLLHDGIQVIDARHGELASGLTGMGRMAEPEELYAELDFFFQNKKELNTNKRLSGKKALVTAGPTYENIDPVRFIGNYSSGKMGIAIAEALANEGCEVELVLGPTSLKSTHENINISPVRSAQQMFDVCVNKFEETDIAVMCAAVADYTPLSVSETKTKKVNDTLTIELKKTKDILKHLGEIKTQQQTLIGFALENDNEKNYALKKLKDKNADAIVLNSLNDAGAGFAHDTNKITIFDKAGNETSLSFENKKRSGGRYCRKNYSFTSMKNLFIFIAMLMMAPAVNAQELNCKAIVIADQIQGTDIKVFKTMEQSITEFVNTRKWGTDNFESKEKIECVFTIIINKQIEGVEGGYLGRLSIQATRPVFNTAYSSNLVNFVDKDVAFKYIQYQPVEFNDNRIAGNDALVSNLPALISYYSYIILGLDYDSYALKGGTEFYNRALNIVNNAPENKSIVGWKAAESQRNRFWLSDQITNNRFVAMRDVIYKYHRLGLDMLSTDAEAARATMNAAFNTLHLINSENPSTMLMQFFFNAKSEEIINYLAKTPMQEKQKLIPMLSALDVSNANKYAELLR
jgi:phosphopantothenoylcysteine decarboxylase/phosphopantothenate--cysteine ligase